MNFMKEIRQIIYWIVNLEQSRRPGSLENYMSMNGETIKGNTTAFSRMQLTTWTVVIKGCYHLLLENV